MMATFDIVNIGYSDGASRVRPRYPNDKQYMQGYNAGYDSTKADKLEDDYPVSFPDGKGGVSKGTQMKFPLD